MFAWLFVCALCVRVSEEAEGGGNVKRRETEERGDTAGQSGDRISGEGQERRRDEDDRMI